MDIEANMNMCSHFPWFFFVCLFFTQRVIDIYPVFHLGFCALVRNLEGLSILGWGLGVQGKVVSFPSPFSSAPWMGNSQLSTSSHMPC